MQRICPTFVGGMCWHLVCPRRAKLKTPVTASCSDFTPVADVFGFSARPWCAADLECAAITWSAHQIKMKPGWSGLLRCTGNRCGLDRGKVTRSNASNLPGLMRRHFRLRSGLRFRHWFSQRAAKPLVPGASASVGAPSFWGRCCRGTTPDLRKSLYDCLAPYWGVS